MHLWGLALVDPALLVLRAEAVAVNAGDLASCPIGRTVSSLSTPCATLLQPRPGGQLVDGIAAHLVTVHRLDESTARTVALQHLAGGPES